MQKIPQEDRSKFNQEDANWAAKYNEPHKPRLQSEFAHLPPDQGHQVVKPANLDMPPAEGKKDDQGELCFRGGAPVSGIGADRPVHAETNQKL